MLVVTVDDDKKTCKEIFRDVFGRAKRTEWIHFESSAEASQYFRQTYAKGVKPDLIVLDVQLEDDDQAGIELLREIRRRDRGVAVVMLSVSNAQPIICASYKAGARAFVTKPGGSSNLRTVVEAVAEIWARAAICHELRELPDRQRMAPASAKRRK